MRVLLDTHILLWATANARLLSRLAREMIEDTANEPFFSSASIWEVSIKNAMGKPSFRVDPSLLLSSLLAAGYQELPVSSRHAIGVGALPALHNDPFDRILVAQAIAEGPLLLTHDAKVAKYPGPIKLV